MFLTVKAMCMSVIGALLLHCNDIIPVMAVLPLKLIAARNLSSEDSITYPVFTLKLMSPGVISP